MLGASTFVDFVRSPGDGITIVEWFAISTVSSSVGGPVRSWHRSLPSNEYSTSAFAIKIVDVLVTY
jgi:hypothetical protein